MYHSPTGILQIIAKSRYIHEEHLFVTYLIHSYVLRAERVLFLAYPYKCSLNRFSAQSRQSAKFILQSSVSGLSHPVTRRRVCPPPFGSGGAHWLAGEGVGGPDSNEGTDTVALWYTVLCGFQHKYSHLLPITKNGEKLMLITSTERDLRYAKRGEKNTANF